MKIFITTGIVSFPFAFLLLTESQAAARAHALKIVTHGDLDLGDIDEAAIECFGDEDVVAGLALYETTKEVQFKAGEVIGCAGDVNKTHLDLLEELPVKEVEDPAGDDFDEARIALLLDVIDKLEEGNEAHWTNSGLPEVAALKELAGGNVTAAERDAAWAEYNKEPAE